MTLTGFLRRSEIGYAEISHVSGKIILLGRRVNSRRQAGVLVTGLEPARACAQRCERSLRLPVSPHQHLVGYVASGVVRRRRAKPGEPSEARSAAAPPRQSRRPRRKTPHALPPAGPQYEITGRGTTSRKREPERN